MNSKIITVFKMYLQVVRLSNVKEKIAKFNLMGKEAIKLNPRKSIEELENENLSTGTLENVKKTRHMVLQLEKNVGNKNDDLIKEVPLRLHIITGIQRLPMSEAVQSCTMPCSSTSDLMHLDSSSNSDTSERSYCSVSSKEELDSEISPEKQDNLSY